MCDDAIRKKNPEERHVLIEVKLCAFVVFVYRLHDNRIERRQLRTN